MDHETGKIKKQVREKAKAVARKIDRPVVVVGMPGSGKSRIGRMLAQALGFPLRDTDQEIESAAGCSVAEIFERFGEKAFRDSEIRVMRRILSDSAPCIVATGGGTLMNEGVADLVRERAFSLWLRAEPELILSRTAQQGGRPLLAGDNPEKILRDLMERRYPVYAGADLAIDVRDVPAEQTLYEVLEKLDACFV